MTPYERAGIHVFAWICIFMVEVLFDPFTNVYVQLMEYDRMQRLLLERVIFPIRFSKVTIYYKLIGYNLNVIRQSACLAINYFADVDCCPL